MPLKELFISLIIYKMVICFITISIHLYSRIIMDVFILIIIVFALLLF